MGLVFRKLHQNRRQKVFNRGIFGSARGLCVCAGGPWHYKINQHSTYSVSRFNLGGLELSLGAKPSCGDGTELHITENTVGVPNNLLYLQRVFKRYSMLRANL